MTNADVNLQVAFNRTSSPAKYNFKDAIDYAGLSIDPLDARGVLMVVDPLGNTIHNNTDYSAPDIAPGSSLLYNSLSLPLDSAGSIMIGSHVATYSVIVDDKITAVNAGAKKFTIAGDRVARIPVGSSITVVRASGNNGTYTVVSATLVGATTEIVVSQVVPNGTVDGSIQFADQEVFSKEVTVEYSDLSPTIKIGYYLDVFSGILKSLDQTVYGDTATITSRSHALKYPADLAKADITGNGAILIASPIYTNRWVTVIETVLSYDLGNGNTYICTARGTSYKDVVAETSLCDISCGVSALNDRYNELKVSNPTEALKEYTKLAKILDLVVLYKIHLECGDSDKAVSTLKEIKTIGQFTESCCADGEESVQIVPVLSGAGQLIQLTEATGITITTTVNGNTINYSLKIADSVMSIINSVKPQNMLPGTGMTTITRAVVAGVETWTFNAVPFSNSLLNDEQNVRSTIEYANPTVPICTITTNKIQKTGTNMVDAVVESVGYGGANWKNLNNLFKVSGFQAVANDDYKVHVDAVVLETLSGGVTTVADQQFNTTEKVRVRVLNQKIGEFYFQFVGPSGSLINNSAMTAMTKKILLNIQIKK